MRRTKAVSAWTFGILLLPTLLATPLCGQQTIAAKANPPSDVLSRKLPKLDLEGATIGHAFWQVINDAQVPGGLVSIEGRPEDQKIDLAIPRGATLRQALDQIVSQSSGLSWKLGGGVVDLFPPWATAAMEILNTRIAAFDFPDARNHYLMAQQLLDQPEVQRTARTLGFQPIASCCGLTGVYYGPGEKRPPPIPVHLKSVTLLEALNAVIHARGEPNLWLYQEGRSRRFGPSFTIVLNSGPPQ